MSQRQRSAASGRRRSAMGEFLPESGERPLSSYGDYLISISIQQLVSVCLCIQVNQHRLHLTIILVSSQPCLLLLLTLYTPDLPHSLVIIHLLSLNINNHYNNNRGSYSSPI